VSRVIVPVSYFQGTYLVGRRSFDWVNHHCRFTSCRVKRLHSFSYSGELREYSYMY